MKSTPLILALTPTRPSLKSLKTPRCWCSPLSMALMCVFLRTVRQDQAKLTRSKAQSTTQALCQVHCKSCSRLETLKHSKPVFKSLLSATWLSSTSINSTTYSLRKAQTQRATGNLNFAKTPKRAVFQFWTWQRWKSIQSLRHSKSTSMVSPSVRLPAQRWTIPHLVHTLFSRCWCTHRTASKSQRLRYRLWTSPALKKSIKPSQQFHSWKKRKPSIHLYRRLRTWLGACRVEHKISSYHTVIINLRTWWGTLLEATPRR